LMRRRFQKGSVSKRKDLKMWVLQWWEGGHKRKRTLPRSKYSKGDADREMAAILEPINDGAVTPSVKCTLGEFVTKVYLPFYRRKWKRTTTATNDDRLGHHLLPVFANQTLGSFDLNGLQDFLDEKANAGLSYSVVAHLRWDLNQIFRMAAAEGFVARNPAESLFVPSKCPRPDRVVMTMEEVNSLFSALADREQLIAKLAVIAGLRSGEIFGLSWGRLDSKCADIRQRVYRGDIDTPKTVNSVRKAALSDGLICAIDRWKAKAPDCSADAWVFPSENLATPLSKDNCWRRAFMPKLKPVGLDCANFQVMRRTHSTLMSDLDVDPKDRAEQMGHTVDVNINVYTRSSLDRRRSAVNALEASVVM
jgi:integrase